MYRIRLSASVIAGVALGLAATGASAGILGPSLNGLKASAPLPSVQKVHEGHGDMHQDNCLRHKAHPPDFPGYPDCHVHLFENGKWWIRRNQLDGTPCPTDCKWK